MVDEWDWDAWALVVYRMAGFADHVNRNIVDVATALFGRAALRWAAADFGVDAAIVPTRFGGWRIVVHPRARLDAELLEHVVAHEIAEWFMGTCDHPLREERASLLAFALLTVGERSVTTHRVHRVFGVVAHLAMGRYVCVA